MLDVVGEVCLGVKTLSKDSQEIIDSSGLQFGLDSADSDGGLVDHFHHLPLLSIL